MAALDSIISLDVDISETPILIYAIPAKKM
ncbi:MAG: hypothetical protein ACI9R3_003103 [Verrucomicrobiales bacterium]|jgi:hypothetical protein